MSSLPILKIHFHGGVVITTPLRQACLPWQPSFLQHISAVLMQQSGYPVFHDRDTPIELGLPWQSSPIWPLSVFHYWNLCSGQYTKTPSTSYISDLYIRLVVTLQFTSLIIDEDNSYWTWSLVFNSNTPNQYSLQSQTLSTYLKLQPSSRQIA